MNCRRFVVFGRVQGVFFRASTQAEAQRLGIEGYAANRADGCVEVVARGSDNALDALQAWLRQGPPRARVDRVTSEPTDFEPSGGFTTR